MAGTASFGLRWKNPCRHGPMDCLLRARCTALRATGFEEKTMPGSTTTLAELSANVAYFRRSWSVQGPVAELVPPVQSAPDSPQIGGSFVRDVYRILTAGGALALADYDPGPLNAQFLALVQGGGQH